MGGRAYFTYAAAQVINCLKLSATYFCLAFYLIENKVIIKFAYWFESSIYKRAKLINVLTPAFRDKLIQEKNVPKEKVIFIPNAADFSLAEKILEDANFNAQSLLITSGTIIIAMYIFLGIEVPNNAL